MKLKYFSTQGVLDYERLCRLEIMPRITHLFVELQSPGTKPPHQAQQSLKQIFQQFNEMPNLGKEFEYVSWRDKLKYLLGLLVNARNQLKKHTLKCAAIEKTTMTILAILEKLAHDYPNLKSAEFFPDNTLKTYLSYNTSARIIVPDFNTLHRPYEMDYYNNVAILNTALIKNKGTHPLTPAFGQVLQSLTSEVRRHPKTTSYALHNSTTQAMQKLFNNYHDSSALQTLKQNIQAYRHTPQVKNAIGGLVLCALGLSFLTVSALLAPGTFGLSTSIVPLGTGLLAKGAIMLAASVGLGFIMGSSACFWRSHQYKSQVAKPLNHLVVAADGLNPLPSTNDKRNMRH